MRILAIRGCNLASLAGEFEIDLARGPLGSAGVFAIVGNTGAGKSTLLDALCVALFDRTPRLANHSTVKIGRGDDERALLGAQDVRGLLRRGASQGWAEVDFESGDARRYRARWAVRRARNQSDGTLQDQQLSLVALDSSEKLGGTKTETLKAIHARLGLSFDQFRRSALLAQGDFAAFLRADGKDRSELLERMTGTQIYSRLSIAAHQRAAAAEASLRFGRSAADAIPVLSDDARTAAAASLALALDAQLAARARHAAAASAARWLAESRARASALEGALATAASAAASSAGASAARASLALLRRAEPLRAMWDRVARLSADTVSAASESAAAARASAASAAALRLISLRRDSAVSLHASIRSARLGARLVERTPIPLAVAPILDARVASGVVERAGARAAGATPATSVVAQDERDRAIRRALDAGEAAAADVEWLGARAPLSAQVAVWDEVDGKLVARAELGEQLAKLDATLREHATAAAAVERKRKQRVTDQQECVARLDEAQRKVASYHARRGLTLDEANRTVAQSQVRVADVAKLGAIAASARASSDALAAADTELAALAAADTAATAESVRLDHELAIAAAVRAEREAALADLRRTAGYAHARAELVDGEPCPLCGADDHPWRELGALDDAITSAAVRVAAAVTATQSLTDARATLAAASRQRVLDRARLDRERAASVAAVTAAAVSWIDHLRALGELALVTDPAVPAAQRFAAERLETAERALDAARAAQSASIAAHKAVAEATAAVGLAQADLDRAKEDVASFERVAAERTTVSERLATQGTERFAQRAALSASIAAAFAHWARALPDVPALRGVASVVRALEPFVADPTGAMLDGLGAGAIQPLRDGLEEIVAEWDKRAPRVVEAEATLAGALAAIEQEARAAEREGVEAGAREAAAAARVGELREACERAREQLAAARAEAAIEEAQLAELLAAPAARAEEIARRLAALELAVERAAAVVAERRAGTEAHEAARPASEAALDDAAQVDELGAMVDAADHEVAALRATLAADEDAQKRRAQALEAVERAGQAAEVDRVLGEVIGSHDGKAFRSFAQSLTLDSLLAVANAHLEELAPRYQLERVPKHDLELQVIDRDMGSEIRSVQSLSGGESFLVSLALALGLSSMSAHDVRVRTLLIDEGFGTLDPSTLDGALAVLDALQATGRQVGVISHVPALVERVGAHVRVVQRGGGRSEVVTA
ncbi:MAG TPA: AAA family ATPase [Kofleriaceae bacterium]|jgi:exonuclease SbcC